MSRKSSVSGLSRRGKLIVYAVLLVCCIPFVFPTWWMATASLKPVNEIFAFPPSLLPRSATLDAYRQVFELQPFGRQYLNSLYIAVIVTLGTLVVSSLAGYAFARIKFRGAGAVFVIVLAGLLVPNEVTIIPLYRMFDSLGLVNTHWPLILIPMLGAPSVLATFIMRQFFITLPKELEEAGRVDGLGRLGLFWQVSLPLARPAIGAVSIFTFLHSWNRSFSSPARTSSPSPGPHPVRRRVRRRHLERPARGRHPQRPPGPDHLRPRPTPVRRRPSPNRPERLSQGGWGGST